MIKFSDGVTVDTSGDYRVKWIRDGYYIVGHGQMWFSSNDRDEAYRELEVLHESEEK